MLSDQVIRHPVCGIRNRARYLSNGVEAIKTRTQAATAVAGKGIAMKAFKTQRMILEATTAKDLMWPDPVSIDESATIREGVAFLVDKGFSAAPVIDRAGRPVGVLSRADVLVHD